MPVCYTCHEEITFDKNIKSKSGKQIPLWPDKQNAHSHDEDGNAIRQPLPFQSPPPQQTQQQSTWTQNAKYNTSTGSGYSQGGQTLDQKRERVMIEELKTQVRELREELQTHVIIDSSRYENQMKVIYEVIAPLLNTQKTAADYLKEEKPEIINHAKKADDYMNFMQSKKNPKIIDEKELDKKIPDDNDFKDLDKMEFEEDSDVKGVVDDL
jgi:hypothetical protein